MFERKSMTRQTLSILSALLLVLVPGGGLLIAQQPVQPPYTQPAPGPEPAPAPAPLLTPDQLDNLVAPIALYPDSLLGQILAASTYPLEIVEAGQWLSQNPGLSGQQLVSAAQQQNWDPSVQALVVFPDVLNRLNSDIRWTTDLGNAFLAQQADVMNAVQQMRQRAEAAGKLGSNSDQTVTTQAQDGQNVIDIAPANPQVVYVPVYNPEYVWGPPAWGYYPPLYYPELGFGFGFGPGIYIGSFFGGLGWGGWGWGLNWFDGSVGLNFGFFDHYGWGGYGGYGGYGGGFGGRYGRFGAGYGGFRGGAWAHNPEHRMGVPYSSRTVANRFGGSYGSRGNFGGRSNFGGRGASGGSGFANASRGFGGQTGNRAGSFGGRGGAGSSGFANANRGFGGQSANRAGSFAGRGNFGGNTSRSFASPGNQAQRGGWARAGASAGTANRYSGFAQANRGGQAFSGNAYRSSPSFNRSAPSYNRSVGSYGGARNMPAVRSTPSYGGGYRSAPSFGGFSGARSAPSFHSSPSFGGSRGGSFGGGFHSSGGGGGFHSSGGGGGFHGGGGGGGFHGGGGGGGSHGGGRR